MCFKFCSKLVITKSWVTAIVGQRVPGHRARPGQQQRMPDDRTCCECDDVVEWWAGSGWQSEDADGWRHTKLVCSSPPGTGAPCFEDTSRRWAFRNDQLVQLSDVTASWATAELSNCDTYRWHRHKKINTFFKKINKLTIFKTANHELYILWWSH